MGFSEDFISTAQSASNAKDDLSSVANSHTENVSSQFSQSCTLQTMMDDSQMRPLNYVESSSSAIHGTNDASSTAILGPARIEEECPEMVVRRRASLERLLGMLYEDCRRRISGDADVTTDSSHLSDCSQRTTFTLTEQQLQKLDCGSLRKRIELMHNDVEYANMKLLKALKQRAHQQGRQTTRCNIITAVLQAMSEKRRIDTKLQFSLDPPSTESGFEEWLNAMKAVARLPEGIPNYFRRKLWITLANYHIYRVGINWEQIRRIAFSEKINPDDDRLSFQIIKDLHRTGWSGISGEAERIHLKRVLLGYARFNKAIGYCQGFNVIAALVLEVTEFKEECALKIMIFLIEQVLPQGYFDQSLRALSVDMAVLRSLLHQRLPKTAQHLDELQRTSECENEPPLTNVFSVHWLMTLFATCLPKSCVYRLWDALMLEGSEVLLRVSLAIWAKLSKKILSTKSTDHFYTLMGPLCQKLTQMRQSEIDNFITIVYTMAEFPYPDVAELRNRFAWNVESHPSAFTQFHKQLSSILHFTDDDASDSEHTSCVTCPSDGKLPRSAGKSDMAALQKQYKLLRQRQKQAAIIIQAACKQTRSRVVHAAEGRRPCETGDVLHGDDNDDASDTMFNHLYVGALLADFQRNDEHLKPPIYTTMNGAVPVTSTIVQPVNVDTLRRASDFAGNEHIRMGHSAMTVEYKQQENGSTKVEALTSDNCARTTTPQKSDVNTNEIANNERTSEAEFDEDDDDDDDDDDEVFLRQFIKSDNISSSSKSDGRRKESAPAVMELSGDNVMKWDITRRSASCAANYNSGCANDGLLEKKGVKEEQCWLGDDRTERTFISLRPSSIDSPAITHASVPLKLTLILANNEKPQIHVKHSITSVNGTTKLVSSTLPTQNRTHGVVSKKQAMTKRSLAVLDKLTKQPPPTCNSSRNPFPVIHKSFRAHSSEALSQ